MICTSQFKHKKNSKTNKDRFLWALKRFCFVFKVSRNRPPSVDVDHGYCGRGGRGVVTRTALSVSGKTNAGVAVPAAQSADVVACEGGGGGLPGLCAFCLALLFLPGSGSGSSPHLSSATSWASSASCCGLLQYPPRSVYWCPEPSCRARKYLYI